MPIYLGADETPEKPATPRIKPIAKPKPTARVRVRYSSCELYSTEPMRCPLCGVVVKPLTHHKCRQDCK